MTDVPILFQNNYCMVFNKPAGLAVQGGEGVKTSLDTILSQKFKPRPLLVHRLDKDTSGLILVAKTREAAASFSSLFAGGRGLVKTYLALCSGVPEKTEGLINLELKSKTRAGRQEGILKKSRTRYRLSSQVDLAGHLCSLLELEPGTGRMHQIRRHLAFISHPILGDDKYGDFSLNKILRKKAGLKHLMLHASRLTIPPMTELPQGLDISAPLPDYFIFK